MDGNATTRSGGEGDQLCEIASEMRAAVAHGMAWISHSEAEDFALRIERLATTPSPDRGDYDRAIRVLNNICDLCCDNKDMHRVALSTAVMAMLAFGGKSKVATVGPEERLDLKGIAARFGTPVLFDGGAHPDDLVVDHFAAKMKAKLARARAKGRGGWDDPAQCSPEKLSAMLHDHVAKGDPIDVANFAMMIEHYGVLILPDAPTTIAEEGLR